MPVYDPIDILVAAGSATFPTVYDYPSGPLRSSWAPEDWFDYEDPWPSPGGFVPPGRPPVLTIPGGSGGGGGGDEGWDPGG